MKKWVVGSSGGPYWYARRYSRNRPVLVGGARGRGAGGALAGDGAGFLDGGRGRGAGAAPAGDDGQE